MKLYIINLKHKFAIFKGNWGGKNLYLNKILFKEIDDDEFNTFMKYAIDVNKMDSYSKRLTIKKFFRKAI